MKSGCDRGRLIGRSFSFQLLTGISQIDVDELFDVIDKAQEWNNRAESEDRSARTPSPTNACGNAAGRDLRPRRQQLHARADAIERLGRGGVNQSRGESDHLLKAGSFRTRKLVRCLAGRASALSPRPFEEARRSFRIRAIRI